MAANHHITAAAHLGGNFTAGKLPTISLNILNMSNIFNKSNISNVSNIMSNISNTSYI